MKHGKEKRSIVDILDQYKLPCLTEPAMFTPSFLPVLAEDRPNPIHKTCSLNKDLQSYYRSLGPKLHTFQVMVSKSQLHSTRTISVL